MVTNPTQYHALVSQMKHWPEAVPVGDTASVRHGGVMPVWRDAEGVKVWLARPRPEKPHLPPPLFQLGKGTRMMLDAGRLRDCEYADLPLNEAQAEPLPVTALREGQEELGLVLDNIKTLYHAGLHSFTSASQGTPKFMALLVAVMKKSEGFERPDPVRSKTEACAWLNPWTESAVIRSDHLSIIQRLLKELPSA